MLQREAIEVERRILNKIPKRRLNSKFKREEANLGSKAELNASTPRSQKNPDQNGQKVKGNETSSWTNEKPTEKPEQNKRLKTKVNYGSSLDGVNPLLPYDLCLLSFWNHFLCVNEQILRKPVVPKTTLHGKEGKLH